jgi:dipeptidyl aminopeptidase/acylaminoacyl peptidase
MSNINMIKAWLVAVVLIAPASLQAAPVTVDDLMRLSSLSDVRLSPDGKQVAYVVSTPSLDTAAHEAVLYRVPVTGGAPVRLTYGTRIFNKPLPSPWLRWSPDGSLLSFVAFVGDVPQVMAMSPTGGEPRAITAINGGVARYEWSPDGRQIAFVAPDPVSPEDARRMKNKSYVEHVDRGARPPRLWLQSIAGGTARALTPADQTVLDFHWAPDGRSLAYGGSAQLGFAAPYSSGVYTVSVNGGEPQPIVSRPGTNRMPQFSPDGRSIAFISTGGRPGMIEAIDLYVVAADGHGAPPRGLTPARELWVNSFAWASDGRSIYYISDEQTNGAGEHMFEQGIYRVSLDGDHSQLVTPGRVVNYSLSLSSDGRAMAYRSVESRTMGDVFFMNLADGRARRLTDINPQLHELRLGDLEPVSWKSFDGKTMWGLLLTPPGYRHGQRLPMVVYCHGGPIGGYTYGLFPQFAHIPGQVDPYPVEAMAAVGMAIFFPMPRGGSGYGVEGFRAIMNRWGEDDYKDIMAGVDAMVTQGIADADRLGVMGASYGGYMTNWIVTQTGRFKAASAAASISDLANLYYLSEGGDFVAEYFGYPWDSAASLVAHSPITHVRNITTPLLIQHGESDNRVPLSQAREFYKAMKTLHKTVEFDIYPRGGHVNYEPPLEREYMLRNLVWFVRWLTPSTVSDSPKAQR